MSDVPTPTTDALADKLALYADGMTVENAADKMLNIMTELCRHAAQMEATLRQTASMLGIADTEIESCKTIDQLSNVITTAIANKSVKMADQFVKIGDFKRALEASYQMYAHRTKCPDCIASMVTGCAICSEGQKLVIDAVNKRDLAMKLCS